MRQFRGLFADRLPRQAGMKRKKPTGRDTQNGESPGRLTLQPATANSQVPFDQSSEIKLCSRLLLRYSQRKAMP